ncbi:hypothetical protein QUF72_04680 [Desulfobacterales bacterium HSG2]|nr:hypothetical protein [Desulfobacterales bacterium HSG2]
MIFVWAASLGLDWQIQARRRICQSGGSRVLRLAETKIKTCVGLSMNSFEKRASFICRFTLSG